MAKGGPKIKLDDDQSPLARPAPGTPLPFGPGGELLRGTLRAIGGSRQSIEGRALPFEQFVTHLLSYSDRPIVDCTNLTGLYNLKMQWSEEDPGPGDWGNAGRNSITGPAQFSLNSSLSRSFLWHDRYGFDFRVDAVNVLNHVRAKSWNTTVNSAQFGMPMGAAAMRSILTTLRFRF